MTEPDRAAGKAGAAATIVLCVLAAMIEGFDIQSAGVAAPRMAPEFHLGPHQLSYILAASPLGLLFGAALGGRLADRLGRKTSLVLAMAVFGLFSILTSTVNAYGALVGVRFLCGLGLGGALPNMVALCAEATAPRRRNTVVSLMAAGMPLGAVACSLIALHWAGPTQWRALFWAGGVAPIVLAPLIWVLLPESHRFRTAAADAAAMRISIPHALFAEGRALSTLMAGLSFFCAYLIVYLLQNWMPSLMVAKGFSKPEAFEIQAAFNIGGAAGGLALGWLMDRGRRWLVIAAAYAGMAFSLLALGGMAHALGAALAVGLLVGFCVTGCQLIQYGLTSSLYATAFRGTGVGFAVALGRLGSIAGPLAAGALLGAGRGAPEVLGALLPVVVIGGLASAGITLRRTAGD